MLTISRIGYEGIEVGAAAYHQYRSICSAIHSARVGNIRLCDLKPSHLEEAKQTWAMKPKWDGEGTIAPRTVRHISGHAINCA